jgi:chromosome segregation ATPase
MKYQDEPTPNLQEMNKEVDALISNPMILVETETDRNEVIRDFSSGAELIAFKTKYETLHQVLRDTMEDEGKLNKKCKEMNSEMCLNNAKIQTAIKLTIEYRTENNGIKNEIDEISDHSEKLLKKEKEMLEKIDKAIIDVANLENELEQGKENAKIANGMALNNKYRKRDEIQKSVQTKESELTEIRGWNNQSIQEIQVLDTGIKVT